MTRWIGSALMFVVLGLACPAAWAGSPTDDVRALFAGASRIMDPRAPGGVGERLDAVRGLIREAVDFREAARLSLGSTWSARTPAERDEFVPLFAEFVERALIAGIAGKIRLGEGIKVSYLDEVVVGAAATVRTTVASRSGIDLPLDYRMIQRGGRWAIRDVVIDGVSLASNYRAQLLRVLQSASYPELLEQMRARVGASAPTPLVASAILDRTSQDFLALDNLAPLAAGVRGTPTDGPDRGAPSPRTASTTLAANPASAAQAQAPALSDRAERRPGTAQDRGETGLNAPAEDRASDRAHWLALDLTLVARAVPDSPGIAPNAGAPPPPAEDRMKSAEPARAGELAKYGELIDLVARTRSAEPSRSIEPPKPALPAKPREQASSVAPMPHRAPAKVVEPTKIAALTMPAPLPKPAAPSLAGEPAKLVALAKPSEPTRPATPARPARLEPEPSTAGRRAADSSPADARRYWVQMGAFKTVDAAQRLVDELVEQGSVTSSFVVVEPASSDVPWARVRVGPFPDRWAAASKVREMQALGHSPFVSGPRD